MQPCTLVLPCLLAVAFLAPACSSPAPEPQPAPAVQKVQGQWILVELNGQPVTYVGGRVPSLDLTSDGLVAGLAGVNRFTGQTDAQGLRVGRFDLGPLAVTKMAGSDELMAFEHRYLAALDSADGLRVVDGKLELRKGSEVLARFAAQT
jgi:heat shock protein HslJ